jgi:C4-dicarboxylate-specific signal transduction histidine kinase
MGEPDRIQLQQVLLNSTTNAIESMATTDGARALGVTSEIDASGGVMVSVRDTGTSGLSVGFCGLPPHAFHAARPRASRERHADVS